MRSVRPLPTSSVAYPVFTAEQARDGGWSMSALKHAVATGRVRRIRRGVYCISEDTGLGEYERRDAAAVHDAVGASLVIAGSAISHRSGALTHGLPVLRHSAPCLTVPAVNAHLHPGLHVHRAPLIPAHLVPGDLALTTVARTVIDLAREHGFDEAVMAGDAALRLRLVDRDDLKQVLLFCHQWPGTATARSAIDFLDARSESPLESRSRIKIYESGLPAPLLRAVIRDQFGNFVARTDFLFDELGVIGEADGRGKYRDQRVEPHEERRRQFLENLNYGFVRWQTPDLPHFDRVVARIWHASRHRFGPPVGSVSLS
jgi:hypothetical protein